MILLLGTLFSILVLPFSWLLPSQPPPFTPGPGQEATVVRWEESYAPFPDPQGPTAPPAPAGQPTPQIPAAPLSNPAPTQVTP